MKKIVAIFLLFSTVFAQCSGSAWHYLPAVSNDKGVLVKVNIALENGTDDIYASIYPKIGISTQESIRNAVEYAFKKIHAEKNNCSVKIKADLPDGFDGYLDGPSGGAAIALMTIAALEGKELRNDTLITGTIRASGKIGQVSGLYEKAKTAGENGLKYFLTPPQTIYERIMLRMLQNKGAITIFEVKNADELYAFLIENTTINSQKNPPLAEEINESILSYPSRSEFKKIAEQMIYLFMESTSHIHPSIIQEEKLGQYFEIINKNEQIMIENGYYFSAANDAFLNYIDAKTIANVDALDVKAKVKETRECLESIKITQITNTNFEWIAAQELRKGWAEKKLSELKINDAHLEEEKYAVYHGAMYADGWCEIVKMLEANMPNEGKRFNELELKGLSEQYLILAAKLDINSEDARWHLENAQTLHSKGMYAGAIFDAVFAIEMTNAIMMYENNKTTALSELNELSKEKRKSLWGDVYASHGAFLLVSGENAESTAYNLFRFAKGLDEAAIKINVKINETAEPMQTIEYCKPNGFYSDFCLSLIFVFIIFSICLIYSYLSTKQNTKVFKKRKR